MKDNSVDQGNLLVEASEKKHFHEMLTRQFCHNWSRQIATTKVSAVQRDLYSAPEPPDHP